MKEKSGDKIRDILEYLRESRKNGSIKSTTATPMIIAINRLVGETHDDNWGNLEVSTLNVDELLKKFKEKTKKSPLADRSYKSYRARYVQAIRTYNSRQQDVKENDKNNFTEVRRKANLGIRNFAKSLLDNDDMEFFPLFFKSGVGIASLPKDTSLSEFEDFLKQVLKYIKKRKGEK